MPAPAILLLALAVLGQAGVLGVRAAAAQPAAVDAHYFRVEVDPELVPRGGWAIQGYVYSQHTYRVGGVRLRCEVLDAAGQVVGQSLGWVPGDVPAGGRAYFYVPVPTRGATYRVTILSFFLIAPGGGS